MGRSDSVDPRGRNFIAGANAPLEATLASEFDALGESLKRRGVDIEQITQKVARFGVAIPSWASARVERALRASPVPASRAMCSRGSRTAPSFTH